MRVVMGEKLALETDLFCRLLKRNWPIVTNPAPRWNEGFPNDASSFAGILPYSERDWIRASGYFD